MKPNLEKFDIQDFNIKQSFVKEDLDYSIAENYAITLRHLENLSQQCFWIFDYHLNNFYYISSNTNFFSKKEIDLVKKNGYDYFIKHTHPNDILYLLNIHKSAWYFLQNLDKNQSITDFKVSYIIQILNTSSKYITVNQQVKFLETDKQGNVWLSLGYFEEVSKNMSYSPYIKNVESGKKTNLIKTSVSKHSFEAPKLTKRELKLLTYLSENFTQKEIAERLFISIETLKGHRKNLYRKLHASDKNEAMKNASK